MKMTNHNFSRRDFLKFLLFAGVSLANPISRSYAFNIQTSPNQKSFSDNVDVRIAIDSWYPYEYISTNENGNITTHGISVDLTKTILDSMELSYQIIYMPWFRGLSELKKQNIDILLSGNWNKEREDFIDFPDTYYSYATWGLYTSGSSNQFSTKVNKKGKLGIIRGYYIPSYYQNMFKHKEFTKNPDSLFKMLERNRIQYVTANIATAQGILKKLNMRILEVEKHRIYSPVFPFIRKEWQHHRNFNSTLNKLVKDGIRAKVNQKYGVTDLHNIPRNGILVNNLKH